MRSAAGESSSSSSALPSTLATEHDPLLESRRKDKSPLRPPPTSQPSYGSTPPAEPHWTEPIRYRLFFLFVVLLGLSCVAALLLLLMTPDFAQRSFKDGVEFRFREASILSSDHHQQDVLSLHVAGDLALKDAAYSLARKAAWLFGDLRILDSAQLQVYHAGDVMGSLDLPGLALARQSNTTQFDFVTDFVITDPKALMAFAQQAVEAKNVTWRIVGPVAVKIGWLFSRLTMDLDKEVFLQGMDGLKQANMTSMSFPGAHPLGGIALEGGVGIYNPSSTLSLDLGDVDFGVFLEDTMIAVVRAKDAKLLGNRVNNFNISGRTLALDPADTLGKQRMETFLSTYLHGNSTTVSIRGSAFGPDDPPGEPSPPSNTPAWLRKALQSVTLSMPFPGASETNLIQSLELSNLKIDFNHAGEPLVSGDVVVMLHMPREMNFALNVTEILPDVYFYPTADSNDPFARLAPSTPSPARTIPLDQEGQFKVESHLAKAPFTVLQQDEFEKFVEQIFNGRAGRIFIRGTARAHVASAFGELDVRGLSFTGVIDTKGMEGMKRYPPVVTSIDIVKGTPKALYLQAGLTIESPSDLDINLGQVDLHLFYNDVLLGDADLPTLRLRPGKNDLSLTIRLWPSVETEAFIGHYISGDNNKTTLVVSGHANATRSKYLVPVMRQLSFEVTPPRFDAEPLLADMQMNLLSSTTVLWLRNPFKNIYIQLVRLNASATYKIHPVGTAYADFREAEAGWQGPVILPPMQCTDTLCEPAVIETPKIPVMTKKLGWDTITRALGGQIDVSVESRLTIMIDTLLLNDIGYQRSNLTTKIRKQF